MASNDELACVYAALILQDDEVGITAEKINSILKAANVSVEPYWPSKFHVHPAFAVCENMFTYVL